MSIITKSSITKDCNKCTILWGNIEESVMKHSSLCLTTFVNACVCVCADHARWLVSGHTVSQTLNSNSFLHSFEAVCVFMQLKGIGLYQTADYYLLHWVGEDLIQLANYLFPPPRFKERIIFIFFFPFAQPSWCVPGKQSCKSCNKNASVSIKQRRDMNRRLQLLCLGQSLVETDCRAGGIITLCVKNTLGANKVAAYLNENTQRLEYVDESRRGSGGDVCLWLCN